MRELCQTHKLVLAPDGKCVVCRRPPKPLFAVREEHETWISRAFTGLLGVGLLLGIASLVYLSQLGPGYTGGRYEQRPSVESATQPLDARADVAPEHSPPVAGTSAEPAPAEASAARSQSSAARPRASAAALQRVEVTMYATAWCDICDRARAFLQVRDIALVEHDIERDPAAKRQLAAINPALSVPTFQVAGKAFVGFNPWDLMDAVQIAAAAPADQSTRM